MNSVSTSRDHRIDWLRGLALMSIFINHMPGNRFEDWTTRNFGFSDAAEVFVLLAGVAAALAYFRRFEAGQTRLVAAKAVKRAGVLYGAHLLSTAGAVGLFVLAAWASANTDYLDLIGVAPLVTVPGPGVVGILTGGYQLGYFNILPMYVILLLALPGLLYLAARDVRLMLAASAALYLAAQLLPLQMPNFPADGGWYFNPFAWQFIFSIGIALGIMRLRGQSVPYWRSLYVLCAAYVAFSAVWMIWSLGGRITYGTLPLWIDTLHKSNLPATRLLHVLALAYLLVHSPVWEWLRRIGQSNPIASLGRNSLPVFVVGSLMSMVGYIVLVQTGPQLWLELVLVMTGLAAMSLAAWISENRDVIQERAGRSAAGVVQAVRWAARSLVTGR